MLRHVIIGNGVAGISAAEAIRNLDPHSSITIIAKETFPPYSRPMISLLLEGSARPEQLPLRSDGFYKSLDIEAVVGQEVRHLDLDARTVRTSRDREIPYDRLLIATGADPRPLKVPGAGLDNVHYMRTEAQVRAMVAALPQVTEALVLGGGLVGFKAAYGLLHRGVKVTMLIKSGHPLAMQVDAAAGGLILDELVSHGLEVRVGTEVVAFEGNGRVRQAVLSDGTKLPCQLAVVGKGVNPALDFVPRDRIEVDLGLRVNRYLETTAQDVYAAGDAAEAMDLARGAPWVNAIWPVAAEQGRLAGTNMAGRRVAYPGSLGRNVIRVFGLDVLTGGLVNSPDDDGYQVAVRLDPRAGTYRKLVAKDDLLVGMVMVGRIEQGGVLLSLIQRRLPLAVSLDRLLNPNFNYGQLLN
jgi:NAD(P)H-nitrite reductase large subunit